MVYEVAPETAFHEMSTRSSVGVPPYENVAETPVGAGGGHSCVEKDVDPAEVRFPKASLILPYTV